MPSFFVLLMLFNVECGEKKAFFRFPAVKSKRGCCRNIPYRLWIGLMIFYSTYTAYTCRANLSISITTMIIHHKHKAYAAECVSATKDNNSTKDDSVPLIDEDDPHDYFEWDEPTQGHILGAYFYGYFSGSCLSGLVVEWIGSFWTIFIASLVAAVMNSGCVYVASIHWGCLVFFRFLMGFSGAWVYPALHQIIAHWAPPEEKGKFVVGLLGSSLGTCTAWFTIPIITDKFGWPWGFHLITAMVFLYLIVFWLVVTDYPEQNRWISPEEVELITASHGTSVQKLKVVAPYKDILKSVPFYAYLAAHFSDTYGVFLQLTETPKFLHEVIGFTPKQAGYWGILPQIGRFSAGLFFGWFGDLLIKKKVLTKIGVRKGFTAFSHIIPGIALLLIWLVGCNGTLVVSLLTISLGFNGAAVTTFLVNTQDMSPNFAGSLFAVGNIFAGTTGFICPELTGFLIRDYNGVNQWGINYVIGGALYICGGLLFIFFGSANVQYWNEKKSSEKIEG